MANTTAKEILKEREDDAVLEQFKRNLDHIQINPKLLGPELTIGDLVLKFKNKVPVKALSKLVDSDNRVKGMSEYIGKALVEGQEEELDLLLDRVDIEGLAEILNTLGEAYTSFQGKS